MEQMVKYETTVGEISLDINTVKKMLVRGNVAISDQEAFLFMKLCQSQKLNPFTNEAYCIKYGTSPAQMVIGYDAYKRRAEENPNYLYKMSGIVVQMGDRIVQKEGACVYPDEKLIGGWCRVFKLKGDREVSNYKECSLAEYDQKNTMWRSKTAMMIEKVAISQALRDSFPADFEGLYTREEMPNGYRDDINYDKPVEAVVEDVKNAQEAVQKPVEEPVEVVVDEVKVEKKKASKTASKKAEKEEEIGEIVNDYLEDENTYIDNSQRIKMFNLAQTVYGREQGNQYIKGIIDDIGIKTTTELTVAQWKKICNELEQKFIEGNGDNK